jgi:hypothetical protein
MPPIVLVRLDRTQDLRLTIILALEARIDRIT